MNVFGLIFNPMGIFDYCHEYIHPQNDESAKITDAWSRDNSGDRNFTMCRRGRCSFIRTLFVGVLLV